MCYYMFRFYILKVCGHTRCSLVLLFNSVLTLNVWVKPPFLAPLFSRLWTGDWSNVRLAAPFSLFPLHLRCSDEPKAPGSFFNVGVRQLV